jgi:RimJ/RimL family protein N-acetyltransferase
MLTAKPLSEVSSDADVRSTAPAAQPHPGAGSHAPVMLPIRMIGPRERSRIAQHLLGLSQRARYLRFGYAATDEQIQRYVDGLDFERDEFFCIYNRRLDLIAMAHLAFSPDEQRQDCAEFGVSVAEHARGRGYGTRLFERAVVAARNAGIHTLFIYALSENDVMLKIARRAGATVVRHDSESEAHLELPAATLDSRMSEIVQQHYAQVDYRLKTHAKQFRAFLGV